MNLCAGLHLYIVVTGEITDPELKALFIMRYGAKEEAVREFLFEASKYTEPGDKRMADSVLQISASVNRELYERLRGDRDMCEALKEIMAEDLRQAETAGMAKGIAKGIDAINSLNTILISEGRLDDLEKAAKDKKYQKKLIRELVDENYET